jgi:hypothetical protein
MTVGIGFQCPDGVVLCADRQITKGGELVYEEQKIFEGHYDNLQCACSYAHNPSIAKNVLEDIFRSLVDVFQRCKRERIALRDALHLTIEEVMKRRKDKNTEMLIAFRSERMGMPPLLFCVRGLVVVQERRQYIGTGDCSVLRYIAELLSTTELDVQKAKAAAIYMVSLANRFTLFCKGIDALVMPRNGDMEVLSAEEIEKYRPALAEMDKALSLEVVKHLGEK